MDNNLDAFKKQYELITMLADDGQRVDCFVIDGILIDSVQYLLVVTCDDFDNDEPDAFILKQIDEDNDEVIYSPVDNDDEYNKALILLQENDTDYEMEF